MTSRFSLVCLAASVFISIAPASDWPGWRGPNRDGFSADKGLAKDWPDGGPKLLWKLTKATDIGTGYGSPAVVAGKIYIIGADGAKQTAQEFVTCLDGKDGKQIWRKKLQLTPGKFNDNWGGGPRSTPTVDGDHLYVLGATGDLVCMTVAKGDIVWKKNLVSDFSGGIPTWGYSESVLIDGNALLCTPGGKGGIVKLNKKTGATIWKCTDSTGGAGYSSIIKAEIHGVKQYIQQTMSEGLGVDIETGKVLWTVQEIKRKVAVIPSPVVHEDVVFFTAGYGAGCEAYKIESGKSAKKLFSSSIVTNHHGGVIQSGGKVYGHSDNGGQWVCIDMKSGDLVWKNPGVGKGSVSVADGYLYCYSESKGELAKVKLSEDSYQLVSKFTIPETSGLRPKDGKIWAHPVIADGKLILRDYEKLFVYDLK